MKPIIQLLTLAAATLFVSCAALSNLMLPVTQGGTMTFAGSGDLTLSKDRGTGLYGYLNDLGTWAIPPQYKSASSFNSDGLACVQVGGLFGAIDRLNQFVIQPRFRSWSDIRNAVTSLRRDAMPGSSSGRRTTPPRGLSAISTTSASGPSHPSTRRATTSTTAMPSSRPGSAAGALSTA